MTTRFTKEHEWIRVDGDVATVGITPHAAEQLGDVVFVDLPEVGKAVEQGKEACAVESVKAASEVYAPVTGEVTEVNAALDKAPETVNEDPADKGWFFKMTVKDKGELDALMDQAAYDAFIKELAD